MQCGVKSSPAPSDRLKGFDHACDPAAARERQGSGTRQEQQRDLRQGRKTLVEAGPQSFRRQPFDHRHEAKTGRSGRSEHGEVGTGADDVEFPPMGAQRAGRRLMNKRPLRRDDERRRPIAGMAVGRRAEPSQLPPPLFDPVGFAFARANDERGAAGW